MARLPGFQTDRIALAQDLADGLASQQTQQNHCRKRRLAAGMWLTENRVGHCTSVSRPGFSAGRAAVRDDYAGMGRDFRLAFIGLVTLTEGTRFLEDVLAQYANIPLDRQLFAITLTRPLMYRGRATLLEIYIYHENQNLY